MFNLTKDEKKIIIFLILSALVGSGINYYKKLKSQVELKLIPSNLNKDTRDIDVILKESKSVNINSSDLEQLTRLPGIGPTLAKRIIEYRNTNGPFKNREDLRNVRGIGGKKFAEIKEFLTLE
jgi:competence protein ComEA